MNGTLAEMTRNDQNVPHLPKPLFIAPISLIVKSLNSRTLFLGKGDVLTYWLLGACESNPVKRKLPDISKLKPLFRLPKTGIPPGSQEVSLTNFFNL